MKNSTTFEEQIEDIAKALLFDLTYKKPDQEFQLQGLEQSVPRFHRGAARSLRGSAPTFDPVAIANYLRVLGDQINEDLEEPARNVIAEADNKKVEKFGEMVESLSRTWQNYHGLQYEKAFLVASVKLFRYLAQKVPNQAQPSLLTQTVNGNPEVRQYIEHQGGWENLVD